MKITYAFLPFALVTAEPAKKVVCLGRESGADLCIEKVDIPSDFVRSFEPVTEAPQLAETEQAIAFAEGVFRRPVDRLVDNAPGFLWRILLRHLWGDFGGFSEKINLDVFCGAMSHLNQDMNGEATPVTLYFKNVANVMQPIGGGFDPSDYQALSFGKYAENVFDVVGTRHDYSIDRFVFSTDFCIKAAETTSTPQI
jgi:hypothetical protein